MNFLHLSVTFPLNMSSSVRPASANSSNGSEHIGTYSSPTSLRIFVSWLAIPRASAALYTLSVEAFESGAIPITGTVMRPTVPAT
ncbi:Os12g0626450 [Oryza sativa Japonica Group]|uniref:Os12g0626450 protein n=1 Tax=Oryza sativa subsp. japonica TaxID=39947 RepID=A0A0P0YCP9_ORYSJ|nr:hypothetical protein EE612_061065 [Oryza sativa]BAT18188.1 Os12g0626450 [Oryza sativa Japonica Group]